MKKVFGVLLISAFAFDAEAYEIQAVYINLNTGVSTGYSFSNNTGNNSGQPSGSSTNNYSLGANIGYNFNQYFATEAGYNQLWLASNPSNSSGQVGVEDITVKGTIPLGKIFSLYGRLGVAGYQNINAT